MGGLISGHPQINDWIMKILDVKFFMILAAMTAFLACEPVILVEPEEEETEDVVDSETSGDNKEEDKEEDKEDTSEGEKDEVPEDEVTEDETTELYTGPYETVDKYGNLKDYVNRDLYPGFKLGGAIAAREFLQKSNLYNLAVNNLDEMTAENAMKYSSVVKDDGSMDFSQVRDFVNAAEQAGLTVYGHTLAWHSQQRPNYLNGLIADVRVETPSEDETLLSVNFNDGMSPFIGWGNNSTRAIVDGALKVTNPSVVQSWEAQFAVDFDKPFVNNRNYHLDFKIKGSSSGKLHSNFQVEERNYAAAGYFPDVSFTTEWKQVHIECVCTESDAKRLVFSIGDFAGDVYIDDFTLTAEEAEYTMQPMPAEQKKQVLTDAMDRWITGMMQATAKKVSVWDVVNESISGSDRDNDGYYELESSAWGSSSNFYWQDYLGSEDYVRIVVDLARRRYAENGGTKPLILFINDYNLESDWDDNKKLRSLIHWIEIWESDGKTKIDGIGTQMHISYYENPATQASKSEHIVQMLQLMADTGKLVKISELDMGYVNMSGTTLMASEVTEEQHRAMADYYEFIVRKYLEIIPPAQQYGITHWCPLDSSDYSGAWRKGEPSGLWDRNYNRKYAYAGFANGLKGGL